MMVRPCLSLLAMLLTAVCLVSTLFWCNLEGDSFLHKADNLLAWTYCAAMMWCAVHCGEGRKLHFTTFELLVVLILVCFLLSHVFFRMNSPGLQLLAHLLFRCVFYSHVMMVPAETDFVYGFLVMSVGYFGHILSMYFFLDWRSTWRQQGFWISCFALLCWIYLSALARLRAHISFGQVPCSTAIGAADRTDAVLESSTFI